MARGPDPSARARESLHEACFSGARVNPTNVIASAACTRSAGAIRSGSKLSQRSEIHGASATVMDRCASSCRMSILSRNRNLLGFAFTAMDHCAQNSSLKSGFKTAREIAPCAKFRGSATPRRDKNAFSMALCTCGLGLTGNPQRPLRIFSTLVELRLGSMSINLANHTDSKLVGNERGISPSAHVLTANCRALNSGMRCSSSSHHRSHSFSGTASFSFTVAQNNCTIPSKSSSLEFRSLNHKARKSERGITPNFPNDHSITVKSEPVILVWHLSAYALYHAFQNWSSGLYFKETSSDSIRVSSRALNDVDSSQNRCTTALFDMSSSRLAPLNILCSAVRKKTSGDSAVARR
mmetsp:Transcript_6486/g.17359  ORF Transcript_6486/g.17359 Transcript_6486/m.17359 type:complete len:352 (-) Transcript_6486:1242-2297(-)